MLVLEPTSSEITSGKVAIALKGQNLANYLFDADYIQIGNKLINIKYVATPQKLLNVLKRYKVDRLRIGTMGPTLRNFFENNGIGVEIGY